MTLLPKSKGRLATAISWGCWLDRLPFAPSLPETMCQQEHVGQTRVCMKGSQYQLSTISVKVRFQALFYANAMNADTKQLLHCTHLNAFVFWGYFRSCLAIKALFVWGIPGGFWDHTCGLFRGHRSWLGSKLAKYRAPRNSGKFREWSRVQDLLLLGKHDQICMIRFVFSHSERVVNRSLDIVLILVP